MAQGDYDISVRIEENTPTADAYGGDTASWATHTGGLTATKHFYSRQGLQRFEEAPGTMTILRVFFKLLPPFPDLTVGTPQKYRVVETASGLEWPVQQIREYSRTMQLDCEKVS